MATTRKLPHRTASARRTFRVAIVGAGKVGTVLGRLLAESGATISCVVSRTAASATTTGRFLGCRHTGTDLAIIPADTDLIFITTPHCAIADVAAVLAHTLPQQHRRLQVCHASGMLTAEVLAPLRERGAITFSFHPLQTFPRNFHPRAILPSIPGITYGVDGDAAGIAAARSLARRLKGGLLLIPPDKRPLYHAACVIASNHLTAMLWILQEMMAALGSAPREVQRAFRPIIEATLDNVARTSPTDALSGPVARGGVATVAEHFAAVSVTTPELLPYFAAMTRETVRLALAKGSINGDRATQFEDVILAHTRVSSQPGDHP